MRVTLSKLADVLDAEVLGDDTLVVQGLSEPGSARETDLALATRPEYASALSQGKAKAALLWMGADPFEYGLQAGLCPRRPRFAMAALTRIADPGQSFGEGIHPSAVIDPSAEIAADAKIAPFSIIGPNARVGAGAVIGPQCYIGAGTALGEGAYLRERVSVGSNVRIGARFIAQPGAVIGSDGFSFVTEDTSTAEAARAALDGSVEAEAQPWHRIHSLGGVEIGDDVEIGANSCIDSGTIRATRIGSGTKLDNLVHIGHNVVIGENCLICGQVGIAGSSVIADQVVLGGQVGVSDNIKIGTGVVAGGGSGIVTNVPAGRMVMGYPATKMDQHLASYKALRRLPRALKDLASLNKAVFKTDSSD